MSVHRRRCLLIVLPYSVPVKITGGPAKAETKEMPRHKKNPAVGTKATVYASEIIIDQQDASTLAIDEEVGLHFPYSPVTRLPLDFHFH
jgi:hypothetical protein